MNTKAGSYLTTNYTLTEQFLCTLIYCKTRHRGNESYQNSYTYTNYYNIPQPGHMGIEKTYYMVAQTLFCSGIHRNTITFVRKCKKCQQTKREQLKLKELMGLRLKEEPWWVVSTDIMKSTTSPYQRINSNTY